MRVVTDDGVGLAVVVAGHGPGLVLVHGFGGAKEDFGDHIDALARDHRVVAFDHRGHGASDDPDDPAAYSLDRLVADVALVADAAELAEFELLGHSMGGMVARRLALAEPARVERLVLMDTCGGPIAELDGDVLEIGARIAEEQGMDALREAMLMVKPLGSDAYERLRATRPGFVEFEEHKWASLSPVMWATMARALRDQPDDLLRMRTITCPTLVVVGEEDVAFRRPSRAMADAVPGAELVVIPAAGHSPQFENPQAWFDVVTGFLAADPRSAGSAA